jgi:hypothetical protein
MIICDLTDHTIYQYSLSSAGDITTATHSAITFDNIAGGLSGLEYSQDHAKLYFCGDTSGLGYQLNLRTTISLKTDTTQGVLDLLIPDGAGISNIVEDTTPQLGGALDVNGKEITGAIDLHSTGDIIQELGDAAGTNKVIIKDSGAVEVAAIDSDGNITTSGTVDGRDVATDGTKLDGVETSADVTDETNVKAALDGATITAATVATGDKVLLQDVDDTDNLKTATAQAIADLKVINVVDDATPQLGGDLDCNGAQIQWSQGADVASATALAVLTDGNYFDVTGTTTITSINTTGGAGTQIKLHFDGALTLTHHATNLILPGGANITTAAGDEAEFLEYGAGTYRCTNYMKADGTAVVAAAGGGTWTLISSQVASASSSIDFTTGIDSTYDAYVVIASNITPASSGPAMNMRISTDGGSTWKAGAADYEWVYTNLDANDSAVTVRNSAGSSSIELMGGTSGLGNGANDSASATIHIYDPSDGADQMKVNYKGTWETGLPILYTLTGSGMYQAATAVDGFRFLMSTGNIASGRFTLYGIAHS